MTPTRSFRISDRAGDALIAAVLAVSLVLQLILGPDAEGPLALNVAGALLLTLPLAVRRSAPLAVISIFSVTAIANESLGGALFTFPDAGSADPEPPRFASLAAGIVAFYSVGAHAPDRAAVVGGLIGLAGLWTTVVVSDQVQFAAFVWSGGLIAATPWFAGRFARSRQLRFQSLEREQEQRTRIALSDERARIARELHDVVAHSVGVIAVQAQGGRRMIERDPARAEQALAAIETTARTALAEMRQALGVLRREDAEAARAPQPGLQDLDQLLAGARASGQRVELAIEGTPRDLPSGVDLTAYRVIQEALTNTIKHADRAPCRVTVRYGDGALEVSVSDDGPGPALDALEGGNGHGIIGMRERVAAVDGELDVGPAPEGGFLVRATLPIE